MLRFKETERGPAATDDDKFRDRGIRCPQCKWRPTKHDRWYCMCGHSWNTFDTQGRCPACDYQWRETQCHKCHAMSPHASWYGHFD